MAEPEESPEEEVVVRLASMPEIITPEGLAPGSAARAASAGVELGRRLLLAARAGDTAAVLDLMAQGAPFTTDWLGTSPLHLAALGGHAGTCAVLLRAGVSRDARTKVERTPLHLAAHAGHERAAAVLLEHGATVDCRDMLRMTPLHWACARGHAALAALLVRRGADPRARCKFRRSALQLAAPRPAVRAAVAEAMLQRDRPAVPEEMAVDEAEQKPYETVPMLVPEDKPGVKAPQKLDKPSVETEQARAGGGGGAGGGGAAALLRQHGITLLPADDGGTVLSALQSGRTVVLSDAGKLMLKENTAPAPVVAAVPGTPATPPPPAAAAAPAPPAAPAAPAARGVVVRAWPARAPPRPGVKVFTVNQLEPDKRDLQIKYVQLPADATILSPHKAAMKAKSKVVRAAAAATANGAATGTGAGAGPDGAPAGNRPGVKIIMNKASFSKLLATATRAHGSGDNEPLSLGAARGEAVVCVPEQFVRSMSARYLRAQLLAAHAALAELQRQLRQARAARPATPPG